MTLAIRPMNDDEIAHVIALWETCGLTRPWNDPGHDIAFARKSTDAEILVGLENAGIVASVMAGHDGHRGVAYYVAVHPDCRGGGHGRTMMAAAEDWCKARGVWKMNLMVRDDNTAALGFYEKLGYTPGGTTQLGKWIDPAREPKKS
ncbi:MAG: GNAT family acetyltransferase [Hyphomicrobiaceae bacterium]